jgi:hypothetical protein
MSGRPGRQLALRGLKIAHILAAILGGVASAAAIAENKWIAAAAAILVVILQIHSLEILRTTLLTDGEKRP